MASSHADLAERDRHRDECMKPLQRIVESMVDDGFDAGIVAEAMLIVANGHGRREHGPEVWKEIVERLTNLPFAHDS
jgi:hypothetical protein